MAAIPTDERLLALIYKHYINDFKAHTEENKIRQTKIWVPLDLDMLAKKLRTDPDLLFGRLYYHMNGAYGSRTGDGEDVSFFYIRLGSDKHVVNFPLMTSVLADLKEDKKRFIVSTRVAGLSLLVSLASVAIALYF